jgi:hypothetical protein
MVRRSAGVPSVNSTGRPGSTDRGMFVNDDFGSRGASGVRLKPKAPFNWALAER